MKRSGLLLAVLMLSGCAHAAVEKSKQELTPLSPAAVEENVVKGKTTKKEILARLGTPNSVTMSGTTPQARTAAKAPFERAAEIWNYWTVPPLEAMQHSGLVKISRVTIALDDKGVALDFKAVESTLSVP